MGGVAVSHTPGPWKADDKGMIRPVAPKPGHVNRPAICTTVALTVPNDEREANAALLAAAPDMYSALRLALNTLGARGGPTAAERDMAMASIRIALRKAEPVKTGS
jgi:hypothetical protein